MNGKMAQLTKTECYSYLKHTRCQASILYSAGHRLDCEMKAIGSVLVHLRARQ